MIIIGLLGLTFILIGVVILLTIKLKHATSNIKSTTQAKSKIKTMKAQMLNGMVNLYGDIILPFTVNRILMESSPIVYLKYYDSYTPMVCLMYETGIGYVLIREDGVGEAKFYPENKVIPCKLNAFVEGYIFKEDDEEVFMITHIPEEEIVHM